MTNSSVGRSPSSPQGDVDAWEEAYLRFETSREEQRKFIGRLRAAGAQTWDRDAVILDLFSGRGGAAQALRRMGFRHVVSIDLSPTLLRAREEPSEAFVADCRQLPIASRSIDAATVHGGLHHLPRIPQDLLATLGEVARVLKPGGVFVAVEPWRTPFLDAVHWICRLPLARTASSKVDALATMIELERQTYAAWLTSDREILAAFDRHFIPLRIRIRAGKLHYVGSPRSS